MDRRLYIHVSALAHLARRSSSDALALSGLLAVVQVERLVSHHLSPYDGIDGLSVPCAERVLQSLTTDWQPALSALFSQVGYVPSIPSQPHILVPVLQSGEVLNAACKDQGYYTFSTGQGSAERMYSDAEPLTDLRKRVACGLGPSDLTMIAGPNLYFIDQDIGTGSVGKRYRALDALFELGEEGVRAFDEGYRRELAHTIGETLTVVAASFPEDSPSVSDLSSAIYRVLTRQSAYA